ncbi:MAG TPA: carboxypeptidase-like regulatory domain-containing protein [Chryseosolibacter sp.]
MTGTVLSAEDGLALPAVRVLLVGTKTETYTDADGKFRFPEELEDKDELSFMFIGLKSQTLRVSGADEMIVRMEAELMPLGGIVVGGARATKRISFRRWWWNLKNLF